jgi:hypothetical protein
MKTIIPLIFFSIIFLTSCTLTNVIPHDESYLKDFNNKLKEETVTIELESGNTIDAKDLQISSNSISWTELESEKHYDVESATIQEIRISNRSRSGTTGLFVGMLVGGIIGANEVSSEGYEWLDGVEQLFRFIFRSEGESKTTRYASGIIMGGVVGGLLGYTIGSIVGTTDKYVFDQDTHKVELKDSSLVQVEFNSIVENGNGYLIILWQEKEIFLHRSEYDYRGTTREGEQFIVIPITIYDSKFK